MISGAGLCWQHVGGVGSTTTTTTTITLVLSRLTFKPLLSKDFFHIKNLFQSHLSISLIRTKSSTYNNLFSAPSLANSVTTSTITAKRKDDSTDPWCTPTLTSNSSENSESTLTLVFAPSYKLITDLTKTAGIPFYLIAHPNTFFATLSKASSMSTKHIYYFLPLAQYCSCILLKINTASILHLSGIKPNSISSTDTIPSSLFLTHYPPPSYHAQKALQLHSSCSS